MILEVEVPEPKFSMGARVRDLSGRVGTVAARVFKPANDPDEVWIAAGVVTLFEDGNWAYLVMADNFRTFISGERMLKLEAE